MSCADSWCHLGSKSFLFWLSRPKQLSSWRWGPAESHDRRRPLQTPDSKRNHIADHNLQLGSCSAIIMVESISGGIVQNPLAALEEALTLTSATFVSKQDTFHDNVPTKN